jgi:hypothetical protein
MLCHNDVSNPNFEFKEVLVMLRARRYAFLVTGAFLLWLAVSCIALSLTAPAKDNPSYTHFGRNISIGPSDEVGDVTCIACSIRVRGLVAGDVTSVGGSVTIEDQAQVSGDVTTVGGNLRLTKSVKVAGDVTAVGGQVQRDPETSVSGDVTALSGRGWLLLVFVVPFIVLGLLVALVVWLVHRMRAPSVPATVA